VLHVPSSDGVTVAVHELAGSSDGHQPVVLVAHATGFHGHAYLPVAAALAPRFHTFALDFRGHGDTAISPSWTVEWAGYGDDALAAAEAVAAMPGAARGLIGFGHSMGGTALLGAARRRPDLFALLVLFEPIVPPFDPATATTESDRVNMLVAATRRRRALFPSIEAARANYAAKPPLDAFDPDALDAYVRFGFHPDVDGAGVRLKCDPELEARTFEAGTWQRAWEILPEVTVPVAVLSGQVAEDQPSRFAADVAGALPKGHFRELGELDHFGPMTHPGLIADLVAEWASDPYGGGRDPGSRPSTIR
jgi:pimeloyl-ACP methyl ester carboxylesterase